MIHSSLPIKHSIVFKLPAMMLQHTALLFSLLTSLGLLGFRNNGITDQKLSEGFEKGNRGCARMHIVTRPD